MTALSWGKCDTCVSRMGTYASIQMRVRIDREVALRALGRHLKHTQSRQQLLVVLRQSRHLAQMVGPAFHGPDLQPSFGMRDVLVDLPEQRARATHRIPDHD